MTKSLTIGTRGSKLALTQSEMMAAELRTAHPGLTVELQIITTKGDRILDVALSAVGDKGLFVKELETALLEGAVDLAVHSCKDLPSLVPDGLTLAAFPEREDPRDALVVPEAWLADGGDDLLAAIPQGACIGTSSLRRACQLRALRPDLDLRDVRGNVDTRLRKLAEGNYDAIVLAAAGLRRLGLIHDDGSLTVTLDTGELRFAVRSLPTTTMLPAVSQGILAIECRADDAETLELLKVLDHPRSRAAALAERAFLRRLEGGCQVPIAAYANVDEAVETIQLNGLVGSLDGSTVVRGERNGTTADPEVLGTALAEELLDRGGAEILSQLREVGS